MLRQTPSIQRLSHTTVRVTYALRIGGRARRRPGGTPRPRPRWKSWKRSRARLRRGFQTARGTLGRPTNNGQVTHKGFERVTTQRFWAFLHFSRAISRQYLFWILDFREYERIQFLWGSMKESNFFEFSGHYLDLNSLGSTWNWYWTLSFWIVTSPVFA